MTKMFNEEKMYTFVKGFAMGLELNNTIRALSYAREKHKNQKRKDGTPYIIHPLTMVCNAIAMGIKDDNVLAVTLLHDVVEDCNVSVTDLPVNDIVKNGVESITFKILEGESKVDATKRYYNTIINSKEATIAKLIDRCHNVSSMAGVFTEEKLIEYIDETRTYVLPLLRKAKDNHPELSNILFCLKYQTCSVVDAIEATLLANKNKD